MLQLPLLGANLQDLSTGSSTDRLGDLAQLLGLPWDPAATDVELLAGLESLLQQLPLEMRQRLGRLLDGGMDLPQAARSLLSEGLAETRGQFQDVLQQRLVDPRPPGGLRAPGEGQFDADVVLPQSVGARTPGEVQFSIDAALHRAVAPLASSIAAGLPQPTLLGGAPAPAPALPAGAPTTTLPPQLAGNLLEMGIPQSVASRGWDTALANRVTWMVQGDQQFARLTLNPPNLGPLDVRVSVQQDQTSVVFIAQHAAVREALEAALPRLREMFDQQSLQLVRADINDPGARQGEHRADSGGRQEAADGTDQDSVSAGPLEAPLSEAQVANGLIDLFA